MLYQKHGDPESSDGDAVLSEVYAFVADSSDDELFDNMLKFEKEK